MNIKEKIMEYSIPEPNSGCWIWLRGTSNNYGIISLPFEKKSYLAHRISYEVFKKKPEKGAFICHGCDNSLCVNPDHLYEGDAKRNNGPDRRRAVRRDYPAYRWWLP